MFDINIPWLYIMILGFIAYLIILIFYMYKVYNEYIYLKQKVAKTRNRTDVKKSEMEKLSFLIAPSAINVRTKHKDLKRIIMTFNVLIRMYWGSIIALMIFIIYNIVLG